MSKAWLLALLTLFIHLSSLITQKAQAQNCASLSGIVNTYAPVSNIAGNVVTIGSTTGFAASFAVGDNVVVVK